MQQTLAFLGVGLASLSLILGCGNMPEGAQDKSDLSNRDSYAQLRQQMVQWQLQARGIQDPAVLNAMLTVPRHEFVPATESSQAYTDSALPIEYGQTISQPYIVALMTQCLKPKSGWKVLEVGTGSGYQAAILAQIGVEVYTIEIIPGLAEQADKRLSRLGYGAKVFVRAGDGFVGWPEAAPFDGIIITCAVSQVPQPLLEQLKPNGRMVLPLGDSLTYQTLTVVTKTPTGQIKYQDITGVVFVPMTGPHGFNEP